MKQKKKIKLNMSIIILFITIVIFAQVLMFLINKSIFRYRPFFTYDKKSLIITRIVEPRELKENDRIVFQIGDRFIEERITKIDNQNNRYYFIVGNDMRTMILNQDQVQGKVL